MCLNPCFNGRYSRRTKRSLHNYNVMAVLILVLMEDTLGVHWPDTQGSSQWVLILVLMEDTLGVNQYRGLWKSFTVLILVLMEDTLGGRKGTLESWKICVLILVLMEDTLGATLLRTANFSSRIGLNPCFNGRYSRRINRDRVLVKSFKVS